MKRKWMKGLMAGVLTGVIILSGFTNELKTLTKQTTEVYAASQVDYPAQTVRISTAGDSKNIGISGTYEGAALNASSYKGKQSENWRFDYIIDGVFRIVNMESGRVLATQNDSTGAGTVCVNAGATNAKAQYWNVSAVSKDGLGVDLYYKITNYLDNTKALTYNASENRFTLQNYSGANNQKFCLNTSGLQGFAGEGKDIRGNVKASDIGGLLGQTVYVNSYDALVREVSDSTPKTVVISGNISYNGRYQYEGQGRKYVSQKLLIGANKTIIGSYSANQLYNVYIDTNSSSANNIILRNITVTHDTATNAHNVWEFTNGYNVWLDHITFVGHNSLNTNSYGGDVDKFIAIVGSNDYITISDCSFGRHEYGVLIGQPDDKDSTLATYKGKPCVTMISNYFNGCETRAPGLMRYGYFHCLNNYVYNFHLGYTAHTAATIFSEKNYYDGAGNTGSVVNDNALQNTNISNANVNKVGPWYTDSGSVAVRCYKNNNVTNVNSLGTSWRPNSYYSYSSMNANDTPNYCKNYAGAKSDRMAIKYLNMQESGMPISNYLVTGTQSQSTPTPTYITPTKTPAPTPTYIVPTKTPAPTPTYIAPTKTPTKTPTPTQSNPSQKSIQITSVSNSWTGGYTMNITIKNISSSSISSWKLYLQGSQFDMNSIWCAQKGVSGGQIIVTPESYNQFIGSNGSVSFGFGGNGAIPSNPTYKFSYVVNGTEYTVEGIISIQ